MSKDAPRIHFEKWRRDLATTYRVPDVPLSKLQDFAETVLDDIQETGPPYSEQDKTTAAMYRTMSGFILSGRQVFNLGRGLCDMFKRTDLSNVIAADVRLPYDSVYIALPQGTLTLTDRDVGPLDVWGIYCSVLGKGIMPLLWAEIPEERAAKTGETGSVRWLPLDTQNIDEEGGLEQTITHMVRSLDDGEKATCMAAFRIAINLALYLASLDAETEQDEISFRQAADVEKRGAEIPSMKQSKREKLLTRLARKQSCRVHNVAPTLEASISKREVGKHWVRGHWHTYLCGKGKKNRILKWIMPHQRGSGKEREGVREYRV